MQLAGTMNRPGIIPSMPSPIPSKKAITKKIAALLVIVMTTTSTAFNFFTVFGSSKALFVKEALVSLIEDRIEFPLAKRFIHFFANPYRYVENVKLDRFENNLRNQGYGIQRGENGKLRKLSIPIDNNSSLDRRLVSYMESGKLGDVMNQYPDVIQYRSVESFGVRQTMVEIDFEKLPVDWGSRLGRVSPDFAQFMNLTSRGMIQKGYSMGKFLAFFKTLPSGRFYDKKSLFGPDRIQSDIEAGGTKYGRLRQSVRAHAAAVELEFNDFAKRNIQKAMLKITPMFLLNIFSPEDAAEIRANKKSLDVPIDEALDSRTLKRGVTRLTKEVIEPIAKRIAFSAEKVLGKKILTTLTTTIGKAFASNVVPGVGMAVAFVIGAMCAYDAIVTVVNNVIGTARYAAEQQAAIAFMVAYIANVNQFNQEGGDPEFSEYLNGMVLDDNESVFARSTWGAVGTAEGNKTKVASIKKYIPKEPTGNDAMGLVTEFANSLLQKEQLNASIGTDVAELEAATEENTNPSALDTLKQPFCTVLDWIDTVASIIISPLAGAAGFLLSEGISWGISSLMPFFSNFMTDYYLNNLKQDIRFEDSVDALVVGALESGNLFFQDQLSLSEPLTRTEARNVYIAQYLDKIDTGQDTTMYAHLFEQYTPSYLARILANPAHADTQIADTPFELYTDIGGSIYGVSDSWIEQIEADQEIYYDNVTGELTLNKSRAVMTQKGLAEVPLTLQQRMDEELMGYVENTVDPKNESFDPEAVLPSENRIDINDPLGGNQYLNNGGSFSATAQSGISTDKRALFIEAGRKNNLPAALLAAIASAENGNSIPNNKSSGYARSVCGAVGLMQITLVLPGEGFPKCIWKEKLVIPSDWWFGTKATVFEQVGVTSADLANPGSPYFGMTDRELADHDIFNIHSSAYGIRIYKMPRLNINKGSDDLWLESEVKAVAQAYLGAYHPYVDNVWRAYNSFVDRKDPSGFLSFVTGNNDIAKAALDFVDDIDEGKTNRTIHYRPNSVKNFNNTYIDLSPGKLVKNVPDSDLCFSGRTNGGNSCIRSDTGIPSWCVDFVRRVEENATGSWTIGDYYGGTGDDPNFVYYPMSSSLTLESGDSLVWVNKNSGGSIHGAILVGVQQRENGTLVLHTVDGNYGNATLGVYTNLALEDGKYIANGKTSQLKGVWRHKGAAN